MKIYYFSATGNSLFAAKEIAKSFKKVELISFVSLLNKEITIEEDVVGFIFPVYAWGLPGICEDILKNNIKIIKADYCFAVVSCAGTPGAALKQLNNLTEKRGRKLDSGFVVKQKSFIMMKPNFIMKNMGKISGEQPKSFELMRNKIVNSIKDRKDYPLELSSWLANKIGSAIHPLAIKQFKTISKGFWVNQHCDGCGICGRVCPRNNIRIAEGIPIWSDECESCFACLQWCPKSAVEFEDFSKSKKRSHNEKVTVKEIINNRRDS